MEGLRGFAVFLVFLVHDVTAFLPGVAGSAVEPFLIAIRGAGHTGVDLFFALSGYLIYKSLITKPRNLWHYAGRRIERIYPAFTAALLLYIALSFVFPSESKLPKEWGALQLYLLENFLLLPGLFPRIDPIMNVAWSLSFEAFFYIATPLVIASLGLRGWSSRQRCALMLVLALGMMAWCARYGGPVRLIMFLAGILTYEWVEQLERRIDARLAALGLTIALAAAGLLDAYEKSGVWHVRAGEPRELLQVGLLFVGYFLLCACCFSHDRNFFVRVFSWRPLRWLGNMSYSYYLIHALGVKALLLGMGVLFPAVALSGVAFVAFLPLAFICSLIGPLALFLLVERPYSLATPQPRPARVSADR